MERRKDRELSQNRKTIENQIIRAKKREGKPLVSENSPRTEMEGGFGRVTQETIRTQTSACKKQKEIRKEDGSPIVTRKIRTWNQPGIRKIEKQRMIM